MLMPPPRRNCRSRASWRWSSATLPSSTTSSSSHSSPDDSGLFLRRPGSPTNHLRLHRSRRTTMKKQFSRRRFISAGAGGLAGAAMLQPGAATAAETVQPWWDARPSSARANRPVAIDLHAHWVPPPYAKAMADLGHPLGNPFPLELDIDQRRKWMDEHGVQMHVLTLNGGMPWQLVTPEEGVRLAQIVNDAGVEANRAFPDHFIASIKLRIR